MHITPALTILKHRQCNVIIIFTTMNPYTTRPTPKHNYQRIQVLNEMRLHRKNMHRWIAEGKGRQWLNHYDEMQRKLDNLNIILFGTIAPGVIE